MKTSSGVTSLLHLATEIETQDTFLPAQDDAANGPGFEMIGNLLYVILILLLIIGMILLLVRFISRKSNFRSHRAMHHLTGIQLAQHKSLQLIELGGTLYLVGVGDDIHLVDKITDPEEISYIKSQLDVQAPAISERGLRWLKESWQARKMNKYDTLEEERETTTAFQEILYRKMNQAKDDRRKQIEDWLNEDATGDRTDKL